MKIFTIPNLLTFIRLVFSPLVLPFLFVYLLPYNLFWLNCILAALFVIISFTDLFDGYIARRFKQETKIGKMLDPIADNFLFSSALIALLAANKMYFYWVIILVGRSLFMMGIRMLAFQKGFPVPVSFLGKINTIALMIYITLVIMNPYQEAGLSNMWNIAETSWLTLVIFLSVFSVKKYLDIFIEQFVMRQKPEETEEKSASYSASYDRDIPHHDIEQKQDIDA